MKTVAFLIMNNVHGPPPETSTVQEYYATVQKVFPLGRCSTNLQECRDTLTLVLPAVLHVIGSSFASWVSVCVCVSSDRSRGNAPDYVMRCVMFSVLRAGQ